MKNKYKVTFLLDKKNLWFENTLRNYNFKLNSKYLFSITKNPNSIKNQDIVFPLSYTKILDENFLEKNELVLIAHPSKLPNEKGFSPLQYQMFSVNGPLFPFKKLLYYIPVTAAKGDDRELFLFFLYI